MTFARRDTGCWREGEVVVVLPVWWCGGGGNGVGGWVGGGGKLDVLGVQCHPLACGW